MNGRNSLSGNIVAPYATNIDHILAHVEVLSLRLAVEVNRRRLRDGTDEGFKGLFVSEEQIDILLSRLIAPEDLSQSDAIQHLEAVLDQRLGLLNDRTDISLQAGGELRLRGLVEKFRLSEFEAAVLVLCVAPEIDLSFETVYAYLQDDINKRRPTLDLALTLFCQGIADRLTQRDLFLNCSNLVENHLVRVGDDQYKQGGPTLSSPIIADVRAMDYLLGSDALDARVRAHGRLEPTKTSPRCDVVLAPEFQDRLTEIVSGINAGDVGASALTLQLVGEKGSGKKQIAKAICSDIGRDLLIIDLPDLLASDGPASELLVTAFREAVLQDAAICLDGIHLLIKDDNATRAAVAAISSGLSRFRGFALLLGDRAWRAEGEIPGRALLTLEVPAPDYAERRLIWDLHLDVERAGLSDEDIGLLAGRFRLNGGQIFKIASTVKDDLSLRPSSERRLTIEDLNAASRMHSNQKLAELAQKISPHYMWDDIILPPDQKKQLREICSYFSNMSLVYDEWGFQKKTNLGKGLNVLFAGVSGTGKTMSADIMAGELGLDLYKIDLSGIVSKYIGETEKNLDRIFREANDSNSILFFDEADALFGKRSEVKDSHDRYANIEVSYLLQKMEEYQGIVILATNFRKNMDDAFVRRTHFVIDYPMPEEENRLEIWRMVFPDEAPQDASVDLGFMARQFKIAGGNIKNIAVSSAFLAAQANDSIKMGHVIAATRREYQKMGKLLVESDFGEYFDLVKSEARV